MKNYGWLGHIPAIGVEKYAYSTIAKTVEIPKVRYNFSAPQLDQGQTPQCGPYSFNELRWTTMRQNGIEPNLIDPQELADAYAKFTGEPFSGVYNRIMMDVARSMYGFKAYHQVNMVKDEICNCLAEGYNFLVGFPVYRKAFEEAINGITSNPQPGDEWLGGHDCTIEGYDLETYGEPVVFGQNHWKNWGFGPGEVRGAAFAGTCHFRMPMSFLIRYGSDAWTITLT